MVKARKTDARASTDVVVKKGRMIAAPKGCDLYPIVWWLFTQVIPGSVSVEATKVTILLETPEHLDIMFPPTDEERATPGEEQMVRPIF